jgi:putative transposase
MSNYRRAYINGGTWFFTVNLLQRHQNDLLIRNIDQLRRLSTKYGPNIRFISMLGLYCLTTYIVFGHYRRAMPDFSNRWRLIKSGFSRAIPNTEYRSKVRIKNGERGIYPQGTSGNDITGNIASAMIWIIKSMWIMCM